MQQESLALVFGPGLPPGGVQGALTISSLGLEVSAADHSQRVRLSEVKLREVGFEKFGLEFAWTDAGASWAAHVLDTKEARRLLALPSLSSTPQASALHGMQRGNNVGRSVGRVFLSIFLLLPVLLLLVFFLNSNRIAGWIADKVPIEQERAWGRDAFGSMRTSLKIEDTGAMHDAVQVIGKQLTQGSKYQYEFHVVNDKSLNAFALPGGIIVVHSGLIAATKRPEELAGVLAHEVQHVELRHSIRGMIKNLGLRGLWAFFSGDLGSSMAGQAMLEMTGLKFSRDDESEADFRGFDALVKADIDPAGMPAFFKTLSLQAADAPVAFVSSHPLSVEREAALAAKVATLHQVFKPLTANSETAWPPR